MKVEIKGLVITAEGEEGVRAALSALSSVLGGVLPQAEALPAPAPPAAIEHKPRKTRQPRKPKYERDPAEPDGFNAPDPPPATPIGVMERKQKTQPLEGTKAKAPGGLATKIIQALDACGGVAPIEHLVHATKAGAFGIKLSVAKCDKLQTLDDGRIALAGWKEDLD